MKCAPHYVEYARALLTKAQAEGDPFGGALSNKEKETELQQDAGSSVADDDEEGEDGVEADEAGDDLELAFQCFEVARLIYEKVRSCPALHEVADSRLCSVRSTGAGPGRGGSGLAARGNVWASYVG